MRKITALPCIVDAAEKPLVVWTFGWTRSLGTIEDAIKRLKYVLTYEPESAAHKTKNVPTLSQNTENHIPFLATFSLEGESALVPTQRSVIKVWLVELV